MAYYGVTFYHFNEILTCEWVEADSIAEVITKVCLLHPAYAKLCETPHRKDEDVYPYSMSAKRYPEPIAIAMRGN